MTDPTLTPTTPAGLIDKLRKVAKCVYLVADEGPARDISETCLAAAAAILASEQTAAALRALVERLDVVHADPTYQTVWVLAQIHGAPYEGPKYDVELSAARAALSPGVQPSEGATTTKGTNG